VPVESEKPVMKLGLSINALFPEGSNLAERVPEMVAQMRAARDAGFVSLWFPHQLADPSDADAADHACHGLQAAHAQGMTIGPNILILLSLNSMHVPRKPPRSTC
jgi:hypothetical protein